MRIDAMNEANAAFDEMSGFAADEQQANGARGILNQHYEKHYDAFFAANNARIKSVSSFLHLDR